MVDLMRGGVLGSMRRAEDRPSDPDNPVSVLRRLFDWSFSAGDNTAALEAIMTKESPGERVPGAKTNSLATAARAGQGAARARFRQSDLSIQVLRDTMDVMTQFNVQEDHDGGIWSERQGELVAAVFSS